MVFEISIYEFWLVFRSGQENTWKREIKISNETLFETISQVITPLAGPFFCLILTILRVEEHLNHILFKYVHKYVNASSHAEIILFEIQKANCLELSRCKQETRFR